MGPRPALDKRQKRSPQTLDQCKLNENEGLNFQLSDISGYAKSSVRFPEPPYISTIYRIGTSKNNYVISDGNRGRASTVKLTPLKFSPEE